MTRLRSLVLLPVVCLAFVVFAAAKAAAESPAPAEDEVRWRGPFRLRGQYPLDLPTLDLTPGDARVLGARTVTIETFVAHSNTFEYSPGFDQRATQFEAGTFGPGWDFDVDSESTRLSVRADFGIGDRFELGVEVPVISHQGGFMDGGIESFHDATGLPNGDRQVRPHGELDIDVIVEDRRFALDGSQVALGDVSVHAKAQLFRSRAAALAAIVDVKAPTGDQDALTGSGEWDYGAGLVGSIGGERNVFHGGIAHYFLGQPSRYPFEVDDRTSAYGAYEFIVNERWSFGVQVLGATSILFDETVLDADRERVEISFGAQHGNDEFEFTFGFTENLTANDNNIDLGLFFGGIWTL